MPLEAEIVLKDGTIISDPRKISSFNRAKFENRRNFEDKVFMAMLRAAKLEEFKNNPKALQESICERFAVSKGHYYGICKTKTMAISPSSRAQLEVMLLNHIGQVMTDHQNIRALSLQNAWEAATSDEEKLLFETTESEGVAPNGEPIFNTTKKYHTKQEAAYKWFNRVISDEKMLYETLKPFITKEFVGRLGDEPIENPEEMMRQLRELEKEAKNREVA